MLPDVGMALSFLMFSGHTVVEMNRPGMANPASEWVLSTLKRTRA
jgi:hypothetical protein